MTPQVHAELASMCKTFYCSEISDEAWALLQIHMTFCDDLPRGFSSRAADCNFGQALRTIVIIDGQEVPMGTQSTPSLFNVTSWLGA